jgi:hypothetical protein
MVGALDNAGVGKSRVTKRSSGEDWVRRVLIAMACFWLLVGVVFPLLDVVNRATNIELVVKIEEPTEQEKREDDFRGQVTIAGQTVLFMKEDGKQNTLYINDKPVELISNKADTPGIYVELGEDSIRRIVCDRARPDSVSEETLPIRPIEVLRTPEGGWRIDDEALPPEDELVVLKRFIGLMNFFDYFGLKGISQTRTFITLANILLAIVLIGFFSWTLIRPKVPFNQNGMLTIAILLLLAFQAFGAIEFLTRYMEESGLAQSVWNSLRVGLYTTFICGDPGLSVRLRHSSDQDDRQGVFPHRGHDTFVRPHHALRPLPGVHVRQQGGHHHRLFSINCRGWPGTSTSMASRALSLPRWCSRSPRPS